MPYDDECGPLEDERDPSLTGANDDILLELLAEEWGYKDAMDFVMEYALKSVQPGICRWCACTTSSCEPDASENWCHNCHGSTVASASTLAGF